MINLPWLENSLYQFPETSTALTDPDGLLCASTQITPDIVVDAYRRGIFPWYSEDQPVLWWSPDPRCVIFPRNFHVSRSFQRTINKQPFEIRTDTCFDEVMVACASPRPGKDDEQQGTWITPAMFEVYGELHTRGIAHSIECWRDEQLVGGIYGLVLGDIFFGESMFSREKDASKVAIHHICTEIKPFLIDAQVSSEHLHTLGAECIKRSDFIEIIQQRQKKSLKI